MEEPAPKKLKKEEDDEQVKAEDSTKSTPAQRNEEGDAVFELSAKRRCTVREWKGNVLVDIREVRILIRVVPLCCSSTYLLKCSFPPFQVYEKDGKMLPGKKGISLTAEQYKALREVILDGSIDKEIEQLQSKK